MGYLVIMGETRSLHFTSLVALGGRLAGFVMGEGGLLHCDFARQCAIYEVITEKG